MRFQSATDFDSAGLPRRQGVWTGAIAISLAPIWVPVNTGLDTSTSDFLVVTISDSTTSGGERRKATYTVQLAGFAAGFCLLPNYSTSYAELEILDRATGAMQMRRGSATSFQVDRVETWQVL